MPMANYFFNANAEDFLGVLFSLSDMVRYLKLSCWQESGAAVEPTGQIVLDLGQEAPGSLALIGNRPELLSRCRDCGAAAVITCASVRTPEWQEALQACPDLGVWQYSGSLMALVTQLPMAIPVHRLMQTDEVPQLAPDQTVDDARAALREARFALPVVNPDGRLDGVLSHSRILSAPRRRVVLVDHFEQHQAPEGIAEAEILEIVDHHRVGTLETSNPIRVDCRPVGSTATIIACKFEELGKEPNASQAKLLLGAIVADTLLLASPTTTATDRRQAEALAARAGVDLQRFGREVLVSNDETLERPPAELIEKDLKEFSACGADFAVAQVETVDRTRLDVSHLEAFSKALCDRCHKGGWDFAVVLLTDIFRGDSIVLSHARHAGHAQALGPSGEIWDPCVSRKKQFLPELLRRLRKVEGQ
jgi:manganese-dependent inorganic pyrophosphatase